ncbi:MAG: IS110 family transposase [Sphaerochaeta sp.]
MLNKSSIRTIGIDVHKESYSLCTYCPESDSFVGEITVASSSKMVANYIRRLQEDVGPDVSIISGYEAGPTGFGLQRDLLKAGIDCKVMAPTTIYEKKGGNRVKTDRGDARKLARALYWGAFKEVIPLTPEDEATRDYIRMRDDRKEALKKAKQQIKSFLLRKGKQYPEKGTSWTQKYTAWLKSIKFELLVDQLAFDEYYAEVCRLEEAIERFDQQIEEYSLDDRYRERVSFLRCFGGIDTHTAMAIVCEVGDFSRFPTPKEFSSYMGLCPGQQSSGGKTQMTGITKAGNSHLRKLLTESANSMARTTIFKKSKRLKARQAGNPADVINYADRGTSRIRYKYKKMIQEGKNSNLAKAACAREIACFVWGMMTGNIYGEVA